MSTSEQRCDDTEMLVRDCRGIACGHGSREPSPETVRARHTGQTNAAFGVGDGRVEAGDSHSSARPYPSKETSRLFRAIYPGRCASCGDDFHEGDLIAREEGPVYVCEGCAT